MDDATYFSRDFHKDLGLDFSTRGALAMKAEGQLEAWLHAYLTSGGWANHALSQGLLKKPRNYRGPLLLALDQMERGCGPEPEMEIWQAEELFNWHIGKIEESLRELEDLPPLVVEDRQGRMVVCDGTHRLEAVRRKGWPACWVIVFDS